MKRYLKIPAVLCGLLLFAGGCSSSGNQPEKNIIAADEAKAKAKDEVKNIKDKIQTKVDQIKKEEQEKVPDTQMLDVPILNQMDAPRLYNGCEVTSLAMLMNYRGIHVSKNDLAKAIKRVPLTYTSGKKGNPNSGFVGNMEDGPGLGVYHGPIAELAKQYAGGRVMDLTGKPFDQIIEQVGKGSPVWIITTAIFAPVNDFVAWDTPLGPIKVTYKEHSVVITGYDQDHIYINDPYGHKNSKLPKESFIKAWEQMGSQAVTMTE
ncbi:C39 family peptidase [Peribacillus kribbensis]|uniref:C39 family peptidase n=1 Tax=Peribacillus kribbensis TaxID=356658 RepID=UPI0004139CCC|nr:C39 family peptidase [Peribacillus kribbensis]